MAKRTKTIQAKQKAVTVDDQQISDNLEKLMDEFNWSVSGMASALKVSVGQMRKYISGSNRISAGRLARIAEIMNVPVERFYAEQERV